MTPFRATKFGSNLAINVAENKQFSFRGLEEKKAGSHSNLFFIQNLNTNKIMSSNKGNFYFAI